MSVLIDIPMPDCCNNCPLSEGYGCAGTGEKMTTEQMRTGRSESCPIIAELPAKHGRLIDVDALNCNWNAIKARICFEVPVLVEPDIGL